MATFTESQGAEMQRNSRVMALLLVLVAVAVGLTRIPSRTAAAEGVSGRKLAFLVGINNYRHAKLDALQFAERDVEELATVLKGQGYTVLLLTPGAGKKDEKLLPTRENIDSRLRELLQKVTREDQVLVGLAGHGIQPDGSADSYFCPLDGNPSVNSGQGAAPARAKFPETLVAITGKQGLLTKLDDSGIGRKMLLIDACRNDPESGRGRGVGSTITELPERTWLLLSCSARQRAWETGKLGGGHGVFFHFVLEGLRGKAADADGEVTWNRLSEYVTRQVEKRVPEVIGEGATQSPDMKQSGSGVPVLALVVPVRPVVPDPSLSTTGSTSTPLPDKLPATDNGKEITNTLGMKLRLIPAGEFLMGSPESDKDASADEKPQHRVQITKAFYLGKHEVTQGEWKAVMKTEPWKGRPYVKEGEDYPVVSVSWDDAVDSARNSALGKGNRIACRRKRNGSTPAGASIAPVGSTSGTRKMNWVTTPGSRRMLGTWVKSSPTRWD